MPCTSCDTQIVTPSDQSDLQVQELWRGLVTFWKALLMQLVRLRCMSGLRVCLREATPCRLSTPLCCMQTRGRGITVEPFEKPPPSKTTSHYRPFHAPSTFRERPTLLRGHSLLLSKGVVCQKGFYRKFIVAGGGSLKGTHYVTVQGEREGIQNVVCCTIDINYYIISCTYLPVGYQLTAQTLHLLLS